MNILKHFFWSKEKEEAEVVDYDELKKIITDTFTEINNIIFIKSDHWLDSNVCKWDKESFDIFTKKIEDNWLELSFWAGEYVIMKNIKNNKWSVSSILCKFKFEEIKNED